MQLFPSHEESNCCAVFDHIRQGMQSDMMGAEQFKIVE